MLNYQRVILSILTWSKLQVMIEWCDNWITCCILSGSLSIPSQKKGLLRKTVSADAGNPLFGGDSEIDTIFKAEQTMVLGEQLGSYKLISCTDDYIWLHIYTYIIIHIRYIRIYNFLYLIIYTYIQLYMYTSLLYIYNYTIVYIYHYNIYNYYI